MIYKRFFAAQNSARGFISRFEDIFFSDDVKRRYIIKGGAGTGKSTLLKKLAGEAEKRGHDVELYFCSSDASSLDGVIIRDMGVCALDATAPHSYDTKYVGCVDTLIDVTRFLNAEALFEKTDKIKALKEESALHFKSAYKSLKAAGTLIEELYESGREHIDEKALSRTAQRLTNTSKRTERILNTRLASAFNARGKTCLTDYFTQVQRAYFIEDAYVTSPLLLKLIEEKAHERVTAFTDPLMPECYEAVYLEDSKILISSELRLLPEQFTRIPRKKFYDGYYKENREKIRFEEKLIRALTDIATDSFKKAKESHDALEKINAAAMDFAAMNEWMQTIISEILDERKA